MALSVALGDVRNQALRDCFGEFGVLAEGLEWRQIGGWEYVRLVPLGGKDKPAPPALVLGALARLAPGMRRRIRKAKAAIRSDKAGRLIERWYADWQPAMAGRMATLQDTDLAALTDAELDDDTDSAVELLREGIARHFLLHGALVVVVAELAFACRDLFGWSDEETCELLAGLSTTSTQPAHRLADLARLAAGRPTVRELLERVDSGTPARLAEADPEVAAAFAAYQREYSCRALRYEIAEKSIAETPELTLRPLADQIARGYDPGGQTSALSARRAAAAERARAGLAGGRRRTAGGSSGRWPRPSAATRCVRTTSSSH
jgi:pyruvate,water dikinase